MFGPFGKTLLGRHAFWAHMRVRQTHLLGRHACLADTLLMVYDVDNTCDFIDVVGLERHQYPFKQPRSFAITSAKGF